MKINIETFKKGDKLKIVSFEDDEKLFELLLGLKIGNIVIFSHYDFEYNNFRPVNLMWSKNIKGLNTYCFNKNCFKKV